MLVEKNKKIRFDQFLQLHLNMGIYILKICILLTNRILPLPGLALQSDNIASDQVCSAIGQKRGRRRGIAHLSYKVNH